MPCIAKRPVRKGANAPGMHRESRCIVGGTGAGASSGSVERPAPGRDGPAGGTDRQTLAAGGFIGGKRATGGGTGGPGKPGRKGGQAHKPAGVRSRAPSGPAAEPFREFGEFAEFRAGWREAVERTVQGLHYELVEIERAAHGLLRVYIDRIPGHAYALPGEFVTVEDCELVTRQLQYALEVAGADYARLEVSSPGLDRPLRTETDYARFEGQQISITLKQPFEGRKVFKGLLGRAQEGGWTLLFTAGKTEQVLGFGLEEVREARLVPVLDFKGRRGTNPADEPAAAGAADAVPGVNGG